MTRSLSTREKRGKELAGDDKVLGKLLLAVAQECDELERNADRLWGRTQLAIRRRDRVPGSVLRIGGSHSSVGADDAVATIDEIRDRLAAFNRELLELGAQ